MSDRSSFSRESFDRELLELVDAFDNNLTTAGRWRRAHTADPESIPAGYAAGSEPEPDSGFKGAVFTDGKRYVLVAGGQETESMHSPQYRQTVHYAEEMKALYGDKLTHITGQNFGGSAGVLAGAKTGIDVVAFNANSPAPRLLDLFKIDREKFEKDANEGQVRTYRLDRDYRNQTNLASVIPQYGTEIKLKDQVPKNGQLGEYFIDRMRQSMDVRMRAEPVHREAADLASIVYDLEPGKPVDEQTVKSVGPWTLTDVANPATLPGIDGIPAPGSGLKAGVFKNEKTGQYALVFAGTEDKDDWKTNALQGVGLDSSQYRQAVHYAKEKKALYGDKLGYVVGHSLGGAEATVASLAIDTPAITFNPAGVHFETLRTIGINNFDSLNSLGINYTEDHAREKAKDLVTAYIVDGEILDHVNEKSVAPDSLGAKILLPNQRPGLADILEDMKTRNLSRVKPEWNDFESHKMSEVLPAMDASGLFPRRTSMAHVLRTWPAEKAVEQYPELKPVYEGLDAVEGKSARMGPKKQERLVSTTQERVAKHIENGGNIPAPDQIVRQAQQIARALNGGIER